MPNFLRFAAPSTLVFSLSLNAFAGSAYLKPEGYEVPAIRIRADSGAALNIPGATYFGQEDPLFLDNRDIVTKFLVYAGEERVGLMRYSGETGLHLHFSPEGSFPSGPSLDPRTGEILFEQVNYGYFSEGLMALSPDFTAIRRSFFDRKYLFTSSPQALPGRDGIVVREQREDAGQALSVLGSGGGVSEILRSTARDPASPYSYIFPPLTQPTGLLAVKVRRGLAGEIAESQGDEILLVDLRVSPARITSLLEDRDIDAASPFAGFDNTGALDPSGNLLWIARLASGHRALVSKPFGGLARILVEEGAGEIARFSDFHIATNARGDVVFRAEDREGRQGVWRTDSAGRLFAVIRENDRLKTDQGPAFVGVPGDFGGVIYMSPQLNARGDILVGAYLRTDEARPRDIGVGYFIVEPTQ